MSRADKILSRSALVARRRALGASGQRVVFTNGCFDVLHRGHLETLRRARALGDCLMVGLNSDASVRALKGAGRPLNGQDDRAHLLAEFECVSHLCLFDEPSVENLIADLRPDVLVKGGDYALEDVVGRQFVEACGGRVVVVPVWPGVSTTELSNRLRT